MFSDQQRVVDLSVNVVGGVDSQRVVELLKSTAAGHPGLVKEPSPQVYVVNFTAGAVTFQLRAWTDQHQEWAQLRGDLSLAGKDALAREKIAIEVRISRRGMVLECSKNDQFQDTTCLK